MGYEEFFAVFLSFLTNFDRFSVDCEAAFFGILLILFTLIRRKGFGKALAIIGGVLG
jgi:hypothetical protein